MPKSDPQCGKLTEENLANFYGSQEYTRHWLETIVMTEGAKFVADNGCAWLLDIIGSHQTPNLRKKSGGFQSWKIEKFDRPATNTKPPRMARVVCDDGNGNILVEQEIEFTTFPFDRFPEGLTLYVELGSLDGKKAEWICMLPRER